MKVIQWRTNYAERSPTKAWHGAPVTLAKASSTAKNVPLAPLLTSAETSRLATVVGSKAALTSQTGVS